MEKKISNEELNDIIIDKPYRFDIDGRCFCLYNDTLGRKLMMVHYIDLLEYKKDNVSTNPYMDALNIVKNKREVLCRIIALNTLRSRDDLYDKKKVDEIASFLSNHSNDDDLIALFIIIFTREHRVEDIMQQTGIERDLERRRQLNSIKKNDNSFKCGGITIYGSLLDAACERYKWTLDYVLWGISYNNLRLMMADAVTSIYLTDEERKQTPLSTDNNVLDAEDPANWSKIRKYFSDKRHQ